MKALYLILVALLYGCTPTVRYQKVAFSDLPHWQEDPVLAVEGSLRQSCQKPDKKWRAFCEKLSVQTFKNDKELRTFLEDHLTPYHVWANGKESGLMTGYYEPIIQGTRQRMSAEQVPILGLPLQDKDRTLTRREIETSLVPIAPVLGWVNNAVDLFILQIQGSGRLMTPQGEIRLGYAGNNDHPFKGLGSIMKQAGVLTAGMGSMPAMRQWLLEHPEQATEIMRQNPRYIFFKVLEGEGPVGSAGLPLTPQRAVAIDPTYTPLKTPVYIATTEPNGKDFHHLMMALDTGADIKGPARVDIFFGAGAFEVAGRMKTAGKVYMLCP